MTDFCKFMVSEYVEYEVRPRKTFKMKYSCICHIFYMFCSDTEGIFQKCQFFWKNERPLSGIAPPIKSIDRLTTMWNTIIEVWAFWKWTQISNRTHGTYLNIRRSTLIFRICGMVSFCNFALQPYYSRVRIENSDLRVKSIDRLTTMWNTNIEV